MRKYNLKVKIDNKDYVTQEKWVGVIDENGNVLEHKVIKKGEEVKITKDNKLTPKQKRLLNYKSELKKFSESLGGYIHMSYVKNELLFNKLDIDRANISRLIYLSTYIDYNDRQENLLIKHGQHKQIEAMTRADIKKILKLSDRAFINFLNDMKKNNLLYEANKKFYISNDYFSKGDCNFNKKEYTRIYIDTTRMLYESCSSRQHKQLSYIYQLVPYMNYELNILCSNPFETDFTKINKLSLKDICELLEVSTESRSMRKLRDELLKFYITIDGNKYYFLSYARILNGYGLKDYFVINPQIVWGGRNIEQVKETIQVCFFN